MPSSNENSLSAAELQQVWRRLARSGRPAEKMELLQKLIAAEPENPAWHTNLLHAESAWFHEELQLAEEAFRQHRDEDLERICRTCMEAKLHIPVPAAAFAPYMDTVRDFRARLQKEQLRAQLQAVSIACEEKNEEKVRAALAEWERLAAAPGAAPDAEKLLPVTAAREFLDAKKAEHIREQHVAEKQAKLLILLDREADFKAVEQAFRKLAALGPDAVTAGLAGRFQEAVQRRDEQRRRRRFQLKILGIALIVMLIAGGVILFLKFQYLKDCRRACTVLDGMLAKNQPTSVLQEIDRLVRTAPDVAGSLVVRVRKSKAEKMLVKQHSESGQFALLLTCARQDLTDECLELEETAQHFSRLQNSLLYRTPLQQSAMQKLLRQYAEMLQTAQAGREQLFRQKTDLLRRQLAELEARMKAPGFMDHTGVEKALAGFAEVQKQLSCIRVRGAEPVLAELDQAILAARTHWDTLLMRRRLLAPQDFSEYYLTLQKIGGHELFADAFASARRQFSADGIQKDAPGMRDAAWMKYHDSAADCIRELHTLLENWQRKLNFYELTLYADQRAWSFRSRNPEVQLERTHGKLGGSFRSLCMQIELPDGRSAKLMFRISRTPEGVWVLQPVSGGLLYSKGLPKAFAPVSSEMLSRIEKSGLPRAAVFSLLEKMRKKIPEKAQTEECERILEDLVQNFLLDATVPSAQQIRFAAELLRVWGTLSDFNHYMSTAVLARAAAAQKEDAAPPEQAAAVQQMLRMFRAALAARPIYRQCAAKAPQPAGVLYLDHGAYTLRCFGHCPARIWIPVALPHSPDHEAVFCVTADARLFAAPGLAEKRLAPQIRKDFFHGKLVFAPVSDLPERLAELDELMMPQPSLLAPCPELEQFLTK